MINTINTTREDINEVQEAITVSNEATFLEKENKSLDQQISEKSVEAEKRGINNEIMTQKTDIIYQKQKIEGITSLKDFMKYWLQQKWETTKILQTLVESIHKKDPRINVWDKENVGFYCWDRALLISQICEKYKDTLWIKSCNMSLPYGHVMDIITLNDGKIYIVDSSAWCFNEITGNFEEERVGDWLTYKLKGNIKCFADQNDSPVYTYTFFPMADKIGWKQFSYITSRLEWFTYFAIKKFYEAAQKTPWYEKISTPEELKEFIRKEVYTKEKPYDGILESWDILITFSKEEQIKMIEGMLSKVKSKEDNEKYHETYQSIIKSIGDEYPTYGLDEEHNLLVSYREPDEKIFKAGVSKEDIQNIIRFCKTNNIKDEVLLIKFLDFLKNPENSERIITWDENWELDKKVKGYLLARNAQANAGSSDIRKELEQQIKALQL